MFIKGQSGNPNGRIKSGCYINCENCGISIYRCISDLKKTKLRFCSAYCRYTSDKVTFSMSESQKNKVISEDTKSKLRKYIGAMSSQWKGGKPKCPDCGKEINYGSKHCNSCKTKYWTLDHKKKRALATSNAMIGRKPANINRPGKFGNVKRGWFDVCGEKIFFRSRWEANYFIYLNFLKQKREIKKFWYEEDTFVFDKIKFGTRSYCPDFKIQNLDDSFEYHEIKGWMTPRSKTQIKRMKIYYPKTKLVLIDKNTYADIKNKLGKLLKFYE